MQHNTLNDFVEQELQWALENYQKLKPNADLSPLTVQEAVLLYEYTKDAYNRLNRGIRQQSTDAYILEYETHLNAVLAKLPDYEGLVFRGANVSPERLIKYTTALENDEILQENCFLSTTTEEHIALDFSNTNTVFHIYSLRGKKVVKFSREQAEAEVLFSSKASFRVLGIDFLENGFTIIKMEEV